MRALVPLGKLVDIETNNTCKNIPFGCIINCAFDLMRIFSICDRSAFSRQCSSTGRHVEIMAKKNFKLGGRNSQV